MKPLRKEHRTRTRGDIPLPHHGVEVMTKSGIRSVSTQWSTYANKGEYEIMQDVVTHGFAPGKAIVQNPLYKGHFIQSGSGTGSMVTQLSPAAWAGTTYECDDSFATRILTGAASLTGASFFAPRFETSWSWEDQAAYEVATTRAMRVPSDANLLVSIAEYRQALAMVPGTWKKWASLLTRIRRQAEKDYFDKLPKYKRYKAFGRDLRGPTVLDVVNSTYLMSRFGLRPLISETQAILKLLQTAAGDEPMRSTQRGTASNTDSTSSNFVAAFGVLRTPVSRHDTVTQSFRAMRLVEAKLDYARQAGLGINQIPEAIVDLIGYSFVVNWLVNVNDYISAVAESMHSDWSELASCVVSKRVTSTTLSITGSSTCTQPTVYQINRHPSGMFVASSIRTTRTIGLPAPTVTVRPRPFKWLSDFRALDAIALVRNLVTSNHAAFMRHI